MRYLKLFCKTFALELSSELVYKLNFIIKSFSLIIADFVSPVLALLIYNTTLGIPGWSFEQFILFQGTLIFIIGLAHLLIITIPYKVIEEVRDGTFDKFLIKPYNTLMLLTFSSVDIEGLAEVFAGLALIVWSFIRLNLTVFSTNFLVYLFLIGLGLLFVYSLMVLIASLSFLVIKAEALVSLFFSLVDLARYPIQIYGIGFRFFLTFLLPVAIMSTYPASSLVFGLKFWSILEITVPVVLFFIISIYLWNKAMSKYSSAGG